MPKKRVSKRKNEKCWNIVDSLMRVLLGLVSQEWDIAALAANRLDADLKHCWPELRGSMSPKDFRSFKKAMDRAILGTFTILQVNRSSDGRDYQKLTVQNLSSMFQIADVMSGLRSDHVEEGYLV